MAFPDPIQLVADTIHGAGVLLLLRLALLGQTETISLRSQELYLLVFINRYGESLQLKNDYLDDGKMAFIFFTSMIVFRMRCGAPHGYTSQDFFQHWKFLLVPVIALAWVVGGDSSFFLFILKLVVALALIGGFWMLTLDTININLSPQIETIRVFYAEKQCLLLAAVMILFSVLVYLQDSIYGLSIILETVVMVPQLLMFYSNGEQDESGMLEWFPAGLVRVPLPIFMISLYRYLYVLHWIYRYFTYDWYQFRPLLHICGVLQCLVNAPILYLFFKQVRDNRLGSPRPDHSGDNESGYSLLALENSMQNVPAVDVVL